MYSLLYSLLVLCHSLILQVPSPASYSSLFGSFMKSPSVQMLLLGPDARWLPQKGPAGAGKEKCICQCPALSNMLANNWPAVREGGTLHLQRQEADRDG